MTARLHRFNYQILAVFTVFMVIMLTTVTQEIITSVNIIFVIIYMAIISIISFMGFKYSSDTELSLKEDEKNIFKLRDICIGKKEI